jgi:TP901 family phage tail tape measure protein
MKGANVQLEKSQRRVNSSVSAGTSVFRTLGRVVAGVQVARFLKDTVSAAINFEDAFAGVRKTVDATEKEFEQLSDGLKDMSREIPIAVTELARIQELAGQLGVRGVANLTAFTESIAKISVTTNLTSESAATSFARIANIMQTPIKETNRMGSAVVELGNNFATTEAEILEFANRIAGAGRVVGLSEADIFAFGAAFSSVGVRAERGGTAVSKALIKIGDSVANGGDELEKFAQVSGLTTDEFIRAWEQDAGKAFALFIEGLGKSGLVGAQILQELELGDQRLVQSFLSVGGASGILTNAIDSSSEAYRKNIALNEEAAKKFGTTASEIQKMKNNIEFLQIEIGVKLLPVFEKLLKVTKQYVDFATGQEFKRQVTNIERVTEAYNLQSLKLQKLINQREKAAGRRFFDPGFLNKEIELSQRKLAVFAGEIQQENNNNISFGGGNTEVGSEANKNEQMKVLRQEDLNNVQEVEKKKLGFIESTFVDVFKLSKKDRDDKDENAQTDIDVTGTTLDTILGLSTAFGKKEGGLFKGLQITKAVIATARAIAESLPNFGLAAAVAAAGAAQIATISAAKFHDGGIIGGQGSGAQDEVPIIAQTGEGILSRRGVATLGSGNLEKLNNGEGVGGGVNVNIDINNLSLSGVTDVQDFGQIIANEIEQGLNYPRG